jgi:tRNA threonylcarbamoyladenosine biosynthesis protein TsaE
MMPEARYNLPEEAASIALAKAIAALLRSGDLVLMQGELGTGKTTITRAIAESVGVAPSMISSPTYVLMHEYATGDEWQRKGLQRLIHIDAYRLRSPDELDSLGWDRVFDERTGAAAQGTAIIIEWADRLRDSLPDPARSALTIDLRHAPPGREATLRWPDAWPDRPETHQLLNQPPTRCRITGEWVAPNSPSYPFASERAKLADLNRWFTGSYTVSRPMQGEDLADAEREQ